GPPDRRGARAEGRPRHDPGRGAPGRRHDDLRLLRWRRRALRLVYREVQGGVRGPDTEMNGCNGSDRANDRSPTAIAAGHGRGDSPGARALKIVMPKLTINGQAVDVPAGTNLIEAARKIGVEIPHYCYHPALSIY